MRIDIDKLTEAELIDLNNRIVLTRYNRKTVTIVTDDGQHWNVSPTLLRRADDFRDSESPTPNIVPLRRK